MLREQVFTLGTIALTVAASAGVVRPTSYDMPNGEVGRYTYFDDTYSGDGNRNVANSMLTGGSGDLTNDVVALSNWRSEPGPYVGWYAVDPTITFRFASRASFGSMTLWFDDANGDGDVNPPARIQVKVGGSAPLDFDVSDPSSGAPFAFTADLNLLEGNSVTVTIFRRPGKWVFLSEARFTGGDSDCNGDGIVDYGQLLRGELIDLNSNGIPDICETSISSVLPPSVPAQGGSTVTIRGNFPQNPTVLIGGVPATNVVRESITKITATTPALLPGMASVAVNDFTVPEAIYIRPECGSDLDQDGFVDAADISILLLDFGPCYTPPLVAPNESVPLLLEAEPVLQPRTQR